MFSQTARFHSFLWLNNTHTHTQTYTHTHTYVGFPGGKGSPFQCKKHGFDPWEDPLEK